jgi:hypothetical protein
MAAIPTRVVYFSPELAAALSPDRARALFAACGAKALAATAAALADGRDPLELAGCLWAKPVPFLLADRLDLVTRFCTGAGRDAFAEAARGMVPDTSSWSDEGPVDLAARLVIEPIVGSVLVARARLRLARLPPDRSTYELRASDWRPVRAAALAEQLQAVVGGAWGEVWVHEDEDGTVHAVLLYAAPAEDGCDVRPRPPRARSGGAGGAPASTRAPGPLRAGRRVLRADAFRFTKGDAPRLVVTTARPMLLDAYAAAWGRALADDEGFFPDAPSLTLKPLQALGARGLAAAALPKGLAHAAVIACQLDTGEADRVEVRGRDVLARLAPHLREGGYLARATLRFDVEGEEHPVDAIIELPNKLTIGAPDASAGGSRGARLVRAALAGLGVLSPGAIADDVTTLLPLVHPEWRWRQLVGDAGLDAMRAAGVLAAVRGEDVRRPATLALRRAGRSVIAYRVYPPKVGGPETLPILAAAYYGVAEDWALPAMPLDVSALAMLRLRLDAIVAHGARAMGLTRTRKPAVPKGVLWVGDLRVASGVVRFFIVVRATTGDRDRTTLGKAITRATGFGRAVVLVPRGRKLGRDFVEVELDVAEQLGAASWRPKLAEAVAALGIEDEVPVELLVPEGVRLVVDTRRERVILDGVPLVKLGDSAYRMLLTLAVRGKGGEVVPGRELDRAISGARGTDGAARMASFHLRRWVDESFASAGRAVPADVMETGLVVAVGRKGWKLTVPAAVL